MAVVGIVIALIGAVFALSTASADENAQPNADAQNVEATPPPASEPDVTTESVVPLAPGELPSVDLSTLEETPIRQWGVVGTGLSYTAAKSFVWDFAEHNGVIYVGGIFTGVQRNGDDPSSQPITQSYLAAFNLETGEWIDSFRPTFNRAVYAVEVAPDGNLLVGGEFTQVNGVNRGGLVKLDPVTGATIASFPTYITAGTNPMVRDIVMDGNDVYIAGQISNVHGPNGAPWRWNAARVNALTGAVDLTFVPRYMGGVWQLAVDHDNDRLHAAGFFTSVAGQTGTDSFASVTLATGDYIPGLRAYEHNEPRGQRDTVAVVYGGGKVYVGGAQHIIQVLDVTNNARVGFITSGFSCNNFLVCGYIGGGDYQVLEMAQGGMLLGGCHCYANNAIYNSMKNVRTNNKFAHGFDTNTNTVPNWSPALAQRSVGTYAIFVDSNHCLYIGGDYVRRGDGAWLGGFGRFCQPSVAPKALTGTSASMGASLTWTAPESPLDVAYYKVYRNGTFAGDVTTTSFGFTNLPAGSQQNFSVRAVDVAGRLSAPAEVTVTISGADTLPPTVPTNLASSVDGQKVTLTWSPSVDLPDPGGVGLSGYLIHRDWNFIRLVNAGTETFTEENVALGTRRYEVRAVDRGNRFSAPAVLSVFVGVTDTEPPTVPTDVAGSVDGTSVTLTWGPAVDLPNPGGVGLSGYLVHRDWNFLKFVNAGTHTFTDVDVPAGRRRYEVRSVDLGNRHSAPAAPVIVTVGG